MHLKNRQLKLVGNETTLKRIAKPTSKIANISTKKPNMKKYQSMSMTPSVIKGSLNNYQILNQKQVAQTLSKINKNKYLDYKNDQSNRYIC